VEIVEMDDEELYVPDDKNQNYLIRKNWQNLRVNENQ
jgi:hypothetical protein